MAEEVDLRESPHPMTSDDELDWQRLGRLVRARRKELGIKTMREAASLTYAGGAKGFSDQTWSSIERAKLSGRRAQNIEALCRVLGWKHGSVEAILRGGDPVPAAVDIRELQSARERIEAAKEALWEVLGVLDDCLSMATDQADR